MSCVLRVSGDHLNVDELLSLVSLPPDNLWRRGEPRLSSKPNGRLHERSGASFLVSDADFEEFGLQVEDATQFLEERIDQIEMIVSFDGVQNVTLDFGIELRDVPFHSDILPPRFLMAAGKAQIAVELSHYPCATNEQASEQPTDGNHH